ncbi:amino acid adenylation domain-containing protein, partial [Streptomyces sioyaensis]|uniref:amino acid adenylation domain-containing protein n=1 Tax=Streptomyces sioyaensis TaxID=67364 RepID=UPI00379B89EE
HNPTHTYTPPTTHPHDLAYIIHTSGSTGTPKGAMNQHDGVVNRLLWMRREFGIGPDDVILQKTPMSFDVSVWEFFLPLISGARMVLADPGGHRDPLHLVDLMRETGVTTAHFVPSMLRYFLAAVPASGLPGLRRIICSGEALPGDLRDLCHKVLPGVRLSNLYGPTEAAIDVTAWHCAPEDSGPAVPIGRPVDNTRVYILDEEHEPLPAGAAGELYLSGVQVGRGYAGRPALTAERFLPDPHSPVPGARMYRTGDRARLRHDGDLEFLGRLDHQIKLRGFRIELGEIEAALRDRPGVRDAAVDVQETVPGHPQLVAYVAGETAQSFSSERIRGALAEVLPAHMIPSHFVFLPELPLNSNGKLDRRALPAPEAPGNRRRQVFASDIERSIGAIWTEVLGRTDLDRTTNFFDAGGDSLLLLRVHSKLGQSVPRARELSPVDLFEFPTIGSLAELLTARETGRKAPPSQRGKLRRSMARRRIRQGGSADE